MTDTLLFLDLDGTIANFEKKANEVLGTDFRGANNDWAWDTLLARCPRLYRDLSLLPDANLLLDYLSDYLFRSKVIVLTAVPSKVNFQFSMEDKRYWVDTRIHPSVPVRFGPYSIDKQKHCTRPDQVLIDDNEKCIMQWRAKGGIGILHQNALSTIKQLQDLGL